MMDLELKLAETGHSQTIRLESSARGETLMNEISQKYKIHVKDQLLITKTGYTIRPQDVLQKPLLNNIKNQTLLSKQFHEEKKISSEKIPCIHLYDMKEVNKPVEQIDKDFKNRKLNELKEQLQSNQRMGLKRKVAPFENLQQSYSKQELSQYQIIVDKIDSVRKSFQHLSEEYLEMKQICVKTDTVQERCQNQRKCIKSLFASMNDKSNKIKKKMTSLKGLQESLSKHDQKSLQENSSFFEMKRKQDQFASIHINNIRDIISKGENVTNHLKKVLEREQKQSINKQHKIIIEYANQNMNRKIDQKICQYRGQYQKLISAFKNSISSQDPRILKSFEGQLNRILDSIKTFQRTEEFEQFYQRLTHYYYQNSELNQNNRNLVKTRFRDLKQWKRQAKQIQAEIDYEEKVIKDQFSKKENKVMKEQSFIEKNSSDNSFTSGMAEEEKSLSFFKASFKTEAEVKRRAKFYKKLTLIQSIAFKLINEEERQRNNFVNESKKGKQNSKELLNNKKVPSLDIDTEGTTDKQLKKQYKQILPNIEQNMTLEEFILIQFNEMFENVKNLLDKDKSKKIKNLQQILKLSTQIFQKSYEEKLKQILTENKNLKAEKEELELKVNQLEFKSSKFAEQKKQYENSAQMLHKIILEKQQFALSLESSKKQEVSKQKLKSQKLLKELKSQATVNEDLEKYLTQNIEENDTLSQENKQLRQILTERQVIIAKLQKEMSEGTRKIQNINSIEGSQQIFLQNQTEFKEKVIIENIKQKLNEDLNDEIKRLKIDNQCLQVQNQNLETDLADIQAELNKIIQKQTEDYDVQVDLIEQISQPKQEMGNSITVNEQIVPGQTCIFMPFSNNLYVGVYYKDEERTICNMSGLQQQPNYLLNLNIFNHKTRELLSQCSFLVILKVQKIDRTDKINNVEGKIQYLLGFQDDNLSVKNYVPYLG